MNRQKRQIDPDFFKIISNKENKNNDKGGDVLHFYPNEWYQMHGDIFLRPSTAMYFLDEKKILIYLQCTIISKWNRPGQAVNQYTGRSGVLYT